MQENIDLQEVEFQSLIGRLQTEQGTMLVRGSLRFQSLIGRLQTHTVPSGFSMISGFNPS